VRAISVGAGFTPARDSSARNRTPGPRSATALALVACVVATGCCTTPRPTPEETIAWVEVRNESAHPIESVRLAARWGPMNACLGPNLLDEGPILPGESGRVPCAQATLYVCRLEVGDASRGPFLRVDPPWQSALLVTDDGAYDVGTFPVETVAVVGETEITARDDSFRLSGNDPVPFNCDGEIKSATPATWPHALAVGGRRVWVVLRPDDDERLHGVLAFLPVHQDVVKEHYGVIPFVLGGGDVSIVHLLPDCMDDARSDEVRVFSGDYERRSGGSASAWILWLSKSPIQSQ